MKINLNLESNGANRLAKAPQLLNQHKSLFIEICYHSQVVVLGRLKEKKIIYHFMKQNSFIVPLKKTKKFPKITDRLN